MKISNVLGGLYKNQDIQQIYYKTYKLFDIEEVEQRPCPLEFPLHLQKSSDIKELLHHYRFYKLEFMYYKDFYNYIENQEDEYIIDFLNDNNNTINDYFLNDEHSVFFQITYNKKEQWPYTQRYNFYILGATKNITIKNNHLIFYRERNELIDTDELQVDSFVEIKFNNELHFEDNSQPIDLTKCFYNNRFLKYIVDFKNTGIKYVNNLNSFCYGCTDLKSGATEFLNFIEYSEVIDLKNAFRHCGVLTDSINLQNIQLSSQCKSDALDYTFYYACFHSNISSQIRHFHYNYLTRLNGTFSNLKVVEGDRILDLSNLDFSNIKEMTNTFLFMGGVNLSNSIFPDVEILSNTFSGTIYLTNVNFPKIKEYDSTFNSVSHLYDFDFQMNIWSKYNQITKIFKTFLETDLTNYDMSNCIIPLLTFCSRYDGIIKQMFFGSKIDYIDLNNQNFNFDITKEETYTKYDKSKYPHYREDYPYIFCGINYSGFFKKIIDSALFDSSEINILDVNNTIFSDLNINTTTIYKERETEQSFLELEYYNIIDALFPNTYIKDYNMNNCSFGENMIPIFSCHRVNNLNLTNPTPITAGEQLSIPPLKDDYGNASWRVWVNNIFSLRGLKKINLQNFIFPLSDLFSKKYYNDGLNGFSNPTVEEINLSHTNIKGFWLKDQCVNLKKVDISYTATEDNEIYWIEYAFSHTQEIIMSNNVFPDEDNLKKIIKYALYLEKIDISNITFKVSLENKVFDLFNFTSSESSSVQEVKADNYPIYHGTRAIVINYASFTSIDFNTFMGGQFLNNTEPISNITITNCHDLVSIKMLPGSYLDFSQPIPLQREYYPNEFIFSLNPMLKNFTFADNNRFNISYLEDISFYLCKSLPSTTLHNIFSHIHIKEPLYSNSFLNVQKCSSLTDFNLTLIETENDDLLKCSGLSHAFEECTNLTSVNLSNIDFSYLSSLFATFYGCSSLRIAPSFNFSNPSGVSLTQTFKGCKSLTDCTDLHGKISSMYETFSHCYSLNNVDLSNLDTLKVTTFEYTFYGCHSLTNLSLTNLNTSNINNFSSMFDGCNSLISLDLSNFDTSKGINFSSMFDDCNSLISLDLSNFDTSKGINFSNMFNHCCSLTSLDLSNFDTSNGTNFSNMFNHCYSLTSLDLSNFDTSNGTKFAGMFDTCKSLTSLDLSNFNTEKAETMSYMFSDCLNLISLNVSNFNVTNIGEILDPKYYKTRSGLRYMFNNCESLRNLNMFPIIIPHSETEYYYIDLSYMFYNCMSLEELDLQGFYAFMRAEAKNFYGINLTNTFEHCVALETIYTDQMDDANISFTTKEEIEEYKSYYENTFKDCHSLRGEEGTSQSTSGISSAKRAQVDQGFIRPGYFTYKSYS